jgi:hypothetical protein
MATEILIVIFIAMMLTYIVYLHIQLAKKNIFIESTIKRLTGIEKGWSPEEMIKFLYEIRKTRQYSSFFADRLFEEQPLHFLLENEKDSKIYIHYTKEEGDARNIIREGFRYVDSFYKTAMSVTDDKLDLLIKHNSRKSFGDYLVILCMSDKIFDHYSARLEINGLKSFAVENVLTESPPYKNENADLVYLLPNRFVKGYINYQTGEITGNPDYNPSYDSPLFEKNLELLKTTRSI